MKDHILNQIKFLHIQVSQTYDLDDVAACADAFNREELIDNCFGQISNATEQMFIDVCLAEAALGGDVEAFADLYTVFCSVVTGEYIMLSYDDCIRTI